MGGYRYTLRIAQLMISLDTDQYLPPEDAFAPFMAVDAPGGISVSVRRVAALPPLPQNTICEGPCFRVHTDAQGECVRSFFDAPRDSSPYAVSRADRDGEKVCVRYLEKGAHCLSQMHNTFFHIGFEQLLLRHERMCIHASCVQTAFGGLLFCGASGAGKSTQAALWRAHRGAQTINDDRPILSRGADGWRAWGSPYAGSSRQHVNAGCPVRAVLLPQKAAENALLRLDAAQAFRALWKNLVIPDYDARSTQAAAELLLHLVTCTPVCLFSCTKEASAVEFLEEALRKEPALCTATTPP